MGWVSANNGHSAWTSRLRYEFAQIGEASFRRTGTVAKLPSGNDRGQRVAKKAVAAVAAGLTRVATS